MAVQVAVSRDYPGDVRTYSWSTMGDADTGTPVAMSEYSDKSVQIGCGASASAGNTFGSATVVIQGTNDPRGSPDHTDHANAVWSTLKDPQGNDISFTASGIKQILENPLWIRPKTSGGTGTDIDVVITGKRTR